MTKREIELHVKLLKDQITLAQLYRHEFIERLGGIKSYEDYINEKLERLKFLLELYKSISNAKD